MLAQILTIVSPISEAFPNLYISWWHPPNGNITRYNKLLWLRALCVFVVWSSIIWILYNNKNNKFGLIQSVSLYFIIMTTFFLRGYIDYNNPIPGYIYTIILLLLSIHLYRTKKKWRIWLGYILIILGAYMISINRPKVINGNNISNMHLEEDWVGTNFWINLGRVFNNPETKDIMGRIKFVIGFINFIYITSI